MANCTPKGKARRKSSSYVSSNGENRYYKIKVSKTHGKAATQLRRLWLSNQTIKEKSISAFFEAMIEGCYTKAVEAGKIKDDDQLFQQVKCIKNVDSSMNKILALIHSNNGISAPLLQKISEVSDEILQVVTNTVDQQTKDERDFGNLSPES